MVLWTSGIVGKVCPKALLVYAHGSPDQTALPATTASTGGVTGQSLTGSRCEWYNRVIITRCLIWPIPLLCKVLVFIRPPNKAARISSGRERERDSDRERERKRVVSEHLSVCSQHHTWTAQYGFVFCNLLKTIVLDSKKCTYVVSFSNNSPLRSSVSVDNFLST